MRLDDPALDRTASEVRDSWLLEAARHQIVFMRAKVPFWRERLSKAVIDESKFESLSDLAQIPILTKEDLRNIRPAVLLPEEGRRELMVCRWTSGTSGRPTVNFWSETDWAALVASTARLLVRQAPIQSPSVFNVYSQAHLTGRLYNEALRRLGGTVFDRSHHSEEFFPTLAQAALFDFDTLILPGRTTGGKGVGLANLLDDDPNFLAHHGVQWWIGSSGTFEPQSVVSALRQGVHAVSNLYGASEFGLFAISCPTTSGDFHVGQGTF